MKGKNGVCGTGASSLLGVLTGSCPHVFDLLLIPSLSSVGYPHVYLLLMRALLETKKSYPTSPASSASSDQMLDRGSQTAKRMRQEQITTEMGLLHSRSICAMHPHPHDPWQPGKRPSIGPSLSIRLQTAVRVTLSKIRRRSVRSTLAN